MNIDTCGLRQIYNSLEEAKLAGVKAVMEAMRNNYQKLLDAGFDPEKFKKGKMNEIEKNKVKTDILKNIVKDDPKYFKKRTVKDIHLGKWEHAVRICCSGKREYYVGKVATSFRPTVVWVQEVPSCDGDDKVVMYIHSHTDSSPNFSGADEKTANEGFKFSCRSSKGHSEKHINYGISRKRDRSYSNV